MYIDRPSGAKADRPSLRAALTYACDGKDTIVATRLDRLSRSITDAGRLVEDLAERRISRTALDVELDTSTASSRPMLKLLLMLAD